MELTEYKLVAVQTHYEVYDQDSLISENFGRINGVSLRGNCSFICDNVTYTLNLNNDFAPDTYNNDMFKTETIEATAYAQDGTARKFYINIELENTGWSFKEQKETGNYMYVWLGITVNDNGSTYRELITNNLYITLNLA
ncbi:MAG: hypothetical protein IJ301_01525 [Clostridia bacterium]|nr:hypothetical protein [Clostridia bacterium]